MEEPTQEKEEQDQEVKISGVEAKKKVWLNVAQAFHGQGWITKNKHIFLMGCINNYFDNLQESDKIKFEDELERIEREKKEIVEAVKDDVERKKKLKEAWLE